MFGRKRGYTLKDIVVYRRTPNHVPFVAYVILSGPRGAEYLLDSSNLDIIMTSRGYLNGRKLNDVLIHYAKESGRLKLIENADFSRDMLYSIGTNLKIPYNNMVIGNNTKKLGRIERNFIFNEL